MSGEGRETERETMWRTGLVVRSNRKLGLLALILGVEKGNGDRRWTRGTWRGTREGEEKTENSSREIYGDQILISGFHFSNIHTSIGPESLWSPS